MPDEIEVVLPDAVLPAVEPGAAPVSDAAEAGIEDLKRQLAEKDAIVRATNLALEEERRRTSEAQRAAVAARNAAAANEGKAAEAERHSADAQYQSITTTLEAEQARARSLASQKAKAQADQEFDKAEQIGLEIGEVTANISKLKDGKAVIEEARRSPQVRQEVPQQQPQPSEADRREQWLTQQNPHNAAWIRQHPEFFSDQKFQRRATFASQEAIDQGHAPGTAEYLRIVEEAVGLRKAPAAEPAPAPHTPSTRTSSAPAYVAPAAPPVAAPPSREVPTNRPGAQGNRITLTKEEADIARATLPPEIIGKNPDGTPKDPLVVFAQNKARMQSDGTWDGWRGR